MEGPPVRPAIVGPATATPPSAGDAAAAVFSAASGSAGA